MSPEMSTKSDALVNILRREGGTVADEAAAIGAVRSSKTVLQITGDDEPKYVIFDKSPDKGRLIEACSHASGSGDAGVRQVRDVADINPMMGQPGLDPGFTEVRLPPIARLRRSRQD